MNSSLSLLNEEKSSLEKQVAEFKQVLESTKADYDLKIENVVRAIRVLRIAKCSHSTTKLSQKKKEKEKSKLNEELEILTQQLDESNKRAKALDDKHNSSVAQLDEHKKSNAELVFVL